MLLFWLTTNKAKKRSGGYSGEVYTHEGYHELVEGDFAIIDKLWSPPPKHHDMLAITDRICERHREGIARIPET